jgi:phage terminase large subunit-like protein
MGVAAVTNAFPDFHALRITLVDTPDDMVHEIAAEILDRVFVQTGLRDADLLWVIESYERRRPRVHSAMLSDGVNVKERFG